MLFLVSNLAKCVFKRISNQNSRFTRCYCDKKAYKLLFFGSDSIALSSFKKVNEFRLAFNCILELLQYLSFLY